MRFADRTDGGRQLAELLEPYRASAPVVLALPRGGVPVGFEVARALGAPLDVIVVRKLGAPREPELGVGALAEGGASYLNDALVAALGVSPAYLARAARAEAEEIQRRVARYRGARPPLDVRGRTVLLVDDGLATGVTTRAAVRALRAREPARVVLAVPVCAPSSAAAIREEVDDVVCVAAPDHFAAVGLWYRDFGQTTDEEVEDLLARARREHGAAVAEAPRARARWSPAVARRAQG